MNTRKTMQQQYCPSQGERWRLHEEGAPLLMDFLSGSEGEEQITLHARESQSGLAIRLSRTYKDVNLRLHLPFQRFAGFFCRPSLICVLVALLSVHPQTLNHSQNNTLFALHSTEAVSRDNVSFEDLHDCSRRVRYARRHFKTHTGDGTKEEEEDFILASDRPYVFDATLRRTGRTWSRHQKSTAGTNSGVPDARGGPKKCALLVWAHDWPLGTREGAFDWSRHWYHFKRELERREEYDVIVLLAPDASGSDSVKSTGPTSVYEYAAFLAQRTQHTLESLLGHGPQPERQGFTSERRRGRLPPVSLGSPQLAGDNTTTPPQSPSYIARLFRLTSESASDSKNESPSGRCTPVSFPPAALSSSPSSAHDCEGRVTFGDKDSSGSSTVPLSPRAPMTDTAKAAALAAFEHPENPPKGARREASSGKLLRFQRLFHKAPPLSKPAPASASYAALGTVDSADNSNSESDRVIEVTEADDDILASGSTCTRVELFLLGRAVGGLALRLMSASPSDTLWDDPHDPKTAVWQEYVLSLHQWLHGKTLDSEGGGPSSVKADLASGGTRERHQTEHLTASALMSSINKPDSISLPSGSAGSTASSHIDSSDSPPTSASITPRTSACTSPSRSGHLESRASPESSRRSSWSLLRYTSSDSFGLSTSEEGDTETSATRLEEKEDVEEEEEVKNIEKDEETQEDYRATPASTSRHGVSLRSVVLEETALAGVKSTRSYSSYSGPRGTSSTVKWKLSATREALRLSTALGRLPVSAQSCLSRILSHVDSTGLLCKLARAEKESYTVQDDKAGSLLQLFDTVLYYGRMSPTKPDVAATQLGISYPHLMQSAAAKKLRRTSDPKSPCRMIDVAVSPLNASRSPFRLRRTYLHMDGQRRPRRGQVSCSPPAAAAADTDSKRTRLRVERAAAAAPEQKSKRTTGKWTRGRGACGRAQGDSTQTDVPAAGENKSQALSTSTAAGNCDAAGKAKCGRTVRFNLGGTICGRAGASTVATATSDTDTEEEWDTEGGYEADSESDDTSADETGHKQSKHTTEGGSAVAPRFALLHSQLLQVLMPPLDICKLTPRKKLYDVTLTLLEAINPQQQPHPYNPVRVGVWKTRSTRLVPWKSGSGARKGQKDASGKRRPPERLSEEADNMLVHMSVRAFQCKKYLSRLEFCGDKNIYSREWFTCGKD